MDFYEIIVVFHNGGDGNANRDRFAFFVDEVVVFCGSALIISDDIPEDIFPWSGGFFARFDTDVVGKVMILVAFGRGDAEHGEKRAVHDFYALKTVDHAESVDIGKKSLLKIGKI